MKLGIIGTGNLGKPIIDRMIENNIHIMASSRTPATYRGLEITSDNSRLAKESEIIILAVKPQSMDEVLEEIKDNVKDKLIITFAAGLKISYYEKRTGARIARVMTNIAVRYGKGISAYTLSKTCTGQDNKEVEKILRCLGKSIRTEDENALDVITGVSGSGIAYFIKIMDIFQKSAIQHGIEAKQAKTVITQTVKGALAMMENTGQTNDKLIREVASKGGTTEQGLKELEEKEIEKILDGTIKRTIEKCRSIGDAYD
ncbi:MAG: pyrroline-5-carboxylate reductase [archaeon]